VQYSTCLEDFALIKGVATSYYMLFKNGLSALKLFRFFCSSDFLSLDSSYHVLGITFGKKLVECQGCNL
jgi:hypothetical protein